MHSLRDNREIARPSFWIQHGLKYDEVITSGYHSNFGSRKNTIVEPQEVVVSDVATPAFIGLTVDQPRHIDHNQGQIVVFRSFKIELVGAMP